MGFKLDNTTYTQKDQDTAKKEKHTSFLQKEITLFGTVFSNKVKEDFYTELSVLLKAGIPLREALVLLCDTQKKKKVQEVIKQISEAIVSGLSLSEAVASNNVFTEYEFYSLKIGEETGTLMHVTAQLGDFFAGKNEQRRQLMNALTYPIIIFSTAFLVVAFMLSFVVPMFQEIFKQQGVELPAITKAIISLSDFFKAYGIWFLVLLVIAPLIISFLKKKMWFQKNKDLLLSRLPFFGTFFKTIYISQFTQAVGLLTNSKVPMVRSIELVTEMIPFYPLKSALRQVTEALMKGSSLSSSLAEHPLFDHKMIALVKVAEETNQTGFIFERLHEQYRIKIQQRSKSLSTIMEPFIILFVGLVVGIILVAMYLPMFQLSSVLG